MNTRSLIATGIICATVIATAAFLSNAGPLTPPAGPIAPTNKTLSEVEPRIAVNATNTPGSATALFVISQPGSYYLTGNITGVASKNGIEITASNVTLDLNGFALQGVAGSLDGVHVNVGVTTGVTVEHGAVTGWGLDGVDMSFAKKSTLRLVRAAGNGAFGLLIGESSVMDACVANDNISGGVIANNSCVISNTTFSDNGGDGISTATGAVIVACAAYRNAGRGIFTNGSTVSDNTARSNGSVGISAGSGSIVSGNTASNNTGDGILVNTETFVRGNTCKSNGFQTGDGAGIHTASFGSRIEGNNVTRNDRGIDVDSTHNLIVRNSAYDNGVNYDIATGNRVGVIVFSPVSGAILGNSGGAGVGTTDPWANFTF